MIMDQRDRAPASAEVEGRGDDKRESGKEECG